MNIVITLPKYLIDAILKGEKNLEMRKCVPRLLRRGEDGFFVVQKGTKIVRCWCRVEYMVQLEDSCKPLSVIIKHLAISQEFFEAYCSGAKNIYLWRIGKVRQFKYGSMTLKDLVVDRAPQSFAYCPLSFGESF